MVLKQYQATYEIPETTPPLQPNMFPLLNDENSSKVKYKLQAAIQV